MSRQRLKSERDSIFDRWKDILLHNLKFSCIARETVLLMTKIPDKEMQETKMPSHRFLFRGPNMYVQLKTLSICEVRLTVLVELAILLTTNPSIK